MIMPFKAIISLPVFTSSGVKLGKIVDANFDIETHVIFQYIVSGGIFNNDKLLIAPSQVQSISSDQMIVDDSVSKQPQASPVSNNLSSATIGGAVLINNEE